MSDTERVFALFVQANPVPEPDLLPATLEEAALPITEGSPIMDTRERIEISTPRRVRRWRPVAVAAAAFVVVLGVVGGAILLLRSDTGLVAAADAAPVVTFDGASCAYEGPTEITPGFVDFTFTNTAAHSGVLSIWWMPDSALAEALERVPAGSDAALTPADPTPAGTQAASLGADPGQTVTVRGYLTAGTVLIDCLTYGDDPVSPDHVWRAEQMIDVVGP